MREGIRKVDLCDGECLRRHAKVFFDSLEYLECRVIFLPTIFAPSRMLPRLQNTSAIVSTATEA